MDSPHADPKVINLRQRRLSRLKEDQAKHEERLASAQRFPHWKTLLSQKDIPTDLIGRPIGHPIVIHSIDHRLDRKRTLEEIEKAGLVLPPDMKEHTHILQRTAEVLGKKVSESCPLCFRRDQRRGIQKNIHGDLRDSYWVYGTYLSSAQAGTGRSLNEIVPFIEALAERGGSLSVHTVEVCMVCDWNYLIHEDLFTPQ